MATEITDKVIVELILENVNKFIADFRKATKVQDEQTKATKETTKAEKDLTQALLKGEHALKLSTDETFRNKEALKQIKAEARQLYNDEILLARSLSKTTTAMDLSEDAAFRERIALAEIRKEAKRLVLATDEVEDATNYLVRDIKSGIKTFLKYASTISGKVVHALKNLLVGALNRVKNAMKSVASFISGTLQHMFGNLLAHAARTAMRAIQDLGRAFLAFTADSTKAAIEFDSAVVTLSNVAGFDKTMEQLHQASLLLGQDQKLVAVSAESAVEGLTALYKAGLDDVTIFGEDGFAGVLSGASRELGAFKSASDLAATSNLEFDGAAKLATVTLATFGAQLESSEEKAQFVNDSFEYMVKTANASRAEVGDFGNALKAIGPTASNLGIPLEEVIDSLAVLADRGITGTTAGTQLRQMLSNMSREVPKVTAANEKLNTSLFDMEGNIRPLSDVIDSFNTALYGTADEIVFVTDATGQQTDQYDRAKKALDGYTTALYDHATGFKQLDDDQLEEIIDAQGRANAVIEGYLEIGGEYIETTKKMSAEERNYYLSTIAGSRGRNTLAALMTDVANAAYDQAIAEGDLVKANKILEGSIGEVSNVYEDLHKKQAEAIGLSEQVNKIIQSTAGKQEIVVSILDTMKLAYGGVFQEALGRLYSAITPMLDRLLPKLLTRFDKWSERIEKLSKEYMPVLVDFLENTLVPALLNLGDWLLIEGPKALTKLVDWIKNKLIPSLTRFWSWVTTKVVPALKVFRDWVRDKLLVSLSGLWKYFVDNILPKLVEFKNYIIDNVIPALTEFWNKIKDDILPIFVEWYNFIVNDILPKLIEFGDYLVDELVERIEETGISISGEGGIIESMSDFKTSMEDVVENSPPYLELLANLILLSIDFKVAVYEFRVEVGEWLLDYFKNLLPEGMQGTIDGMQKMTDDSIPNLNEAIVRISDGLRKDGLIGGFIALSDILWELVEDAVPGITESLQPWADDIFPAINFELGFMQEAFQWLTDNWTEHIVPLLGDLNELWDKFWEAVVLASEVVVLLVEDLGFLEEIGIKVDELFTWFYGTTLGKWITSLGDAETATEDMTEDLEGMDKVLKDIGTWVLATWSSVTNNIKLGLESIQGVLESVSGFLDGLLEKLQRYKDGISGLSGVPDAPSSSGTSTPSTGGGIPENVGTTVNTTINNNSFIQENTVNATTPASAQELTSVFGTMNFGNI